MGRIAKLIAMGVIGGGAQAVTYLLRDEFTTDEAAPMVTPRTCQPGPGTFAITDPGNKVLITSGQLKMTSASAWTTWIISSASYARAIGRALLVRTVPVSASAEIGFNSASAPAAGRLSGPSVNAYDGIIRVGGVDTLPATNGNFYTIALVLRSTGETVLVKGDAQYPAWRLVSHSPFSNTTPLYVGVNLFHAVARYYDYIRLADLPAPFTTDNGIFSLIVASPADGTEYTGNADGITDLTVTAPAVLDGADTTRCGFYYRADADLTPAWHCYVDGLGRFRLDSIAADGTRTNQISVNSVIAGGATVTLRSDHAGALHNCYSLNATVMTKRGTQVNVSLNDTVTTIVPSIPAGWSASNLKCAPVVSSGYNVLDSF